MESAKVRFSSKKVQQNTEKKHQKRNCSKAKAAVLHFLIEKFSDFRVCAIFSRYFCFCVVICGFNFVCQVFSTWNFNRFHMIFFLVVALNSIYLFHLSFINYARRTKFNRMFFTRTTDMQTVYQQLHFAWRAEERKSCILVIYHWSNCKKIKSILEVRNKQILRCTNLKIHTADENSIWSKSKSKPRQ